MNLSLKAHFRGVGGEIKVVRKEKKRVVCKEWAGEMGMATFSENWELAILVSPTKNGAD
jgi:hypothetical protein